jgi:hypothetical protein
MATEYLVSIRVIRFTDDGTSCQSGIILGGSQWRQFPAVIRTGKSASIWLMLLEASLGRIVERRVIATAPSRVPFLHPAKVGHSRTAGLDAETLGGLSHKMASNSSPSGFRNIHGNEKIARSDFAVGSTAHVWLNHCLHSANRFALHSPKQRIFGPAATATYWFPPTAKVMGEAFMRTLVENARAFFRRADLPLRSLRLAGRRKPDLRLWRGRRSKSWRVRAQAAESPKQCRPFQC